jgi:hypothetical protein
LYSEDSFGLPSRCEEDPLAMMRQSATYKLAIFDFDGTLADSFPFFLSVFNTIADRHGFKRTRNSRRPLP